MPDRQPVFEHSFDLPSPPDRVFRAFTDPAELRVWLADRVAIDPREGGAYRFWGRHVLGAPGADAADQRIVALDAPSHLSFTWTVCGVPSRVDLSLAAAAPTPVRPGAEAPPPAQGTTLTVRHAIEGTLPFPRPEQLLDDCWRLACGNLLGHLAGDGNVVLPDFGDDTATVRLAIEIDATPADVFRALLEPAQLERWIARSARVEPTVGGVWDLGFGADPAAPTCRILALEPGRRLVVSWPDWRGDPAVPDQRVTWTLVPLDRGARTRVELVHDGFVRVADRSDYQQGWTPMLAALRRLFDGRPA